MRPAKRPKTTVKPKRGPTGGVLPAFLRSEINGNRQKAITAFLVCTVAKNNKEMKADIIDATRILAEHSGKKHAHRGTRTNQPMGAAINIEDPIFNGLITTIKDTFPKINSQLKASIDIIKKFELQNEIYNLFRKDPENPDAIIGIYNLLETLYSTTSSVILLFPNQDFSDEVKTPWNDFITNLTYIKNYYPQQQHAAITDPMESKSACCGSPPRTPSRS